jgi:hypothetical protein
MVVVYRREPLADVGRLMWIVALLWLLRRAERPTSIHVRTVSCVVHVHVSDGRSTRNRNQLNDERLRRSDSLYQR